MAAPPHPVPRKGHIFLSHAGADTQAARQLAEILRRQGLDIWFDRDNLQPGDTWMPTLEEAISQASAMVVYIGSLGIQAWVDSRSPFRPRTQHRQWSSLPLYTCPGRGSGPRKAPAVRPAAPMRGPPRPPTRPGTNPAPDRCPAQRIAPSCHSRRILDYSHRW
jgi:hypothetical protein